LIVYENPSANNLNIDICDDGDGFVAFDLTEFNTQINNSAGTTIAYFENEVDALTGADEITSPYTNTQSPQQNIIALVTDNNACTSISEINLQVVALPDINVSPQHESCLGSNDGTVQINATDGQSFSIDGINWQASNNFSQLPSGNYYAHVENNFACVDSLEFVINPGLEMSLVDLLIDCNDNNTPSDETDDFYTLNFKVETNIMVNNTFTISDGTNDLGSYQYDETITLVFPALNQSLTITIQDDITGCIVQQDLVTLQTCSSDCELQISLFEMECSSNNTPTDGSDDIYTFSLLVNAVNGSSNNTYDVLIDNVLLNSFAYGMNAEFSLPADSSTPIITVVDSEDMACQIIQSIDPLTPCSDDCLISAMVDDIFCDDQGTAGDPSDDTFSFDLSVTGINTASSWSSDLAGVSGNYNLTENFGSFLISEGDILLSVFYNDDPSCSIMLSIQAPLSCTTCDTDLDAGNPQTTEAGWYFLTGDFGPNCTAIDSILVSEDMEAPNAEINIVIDKLDCEQEEINLNGNNSSTGPEFIYEWTGPGIVEGIFGLEPTINLPGDYELMVTNTINGCTDSASINVESSTEIPYAASIIINPPLCINDLGSAEIISIDGGTPPYTYSIDNGNTFSSETTLDLLESGMYDLLIRDSNACEYIESFIIPNIPALTLDIQSDIIVVAGENVQLNATVNIPESQIDEIIWTPEDWLSCADCLNPIATPLDNITYELIVIDENGCEVSRNVSLLLDNELNIYFPNVFSPDDDNFNDVYIPFAAENTVTNINKLEIYDRWGERIFSGKNFQPNDETFGWDGSFQGQRLNPGVFVYLAEVVFTNGETIIFKGDLTLVR